MVADLIGRLRSPGFKESKLTIGVVTFNGEQQKLIEDLLDTERRKDPALESYFSESELEPVFVKTWKVFRVTSATLCTSRLPTAPMLQATLP